MKIDDLFEIGRRMDERDLPVEGRHVALLGSQIANLIVQMPFCPDEGANYRVANAVMQGDYGKAPKSVAGFTVHVVDDSAAVQMGEADQYPKAWIGT